MDAKTTCKTLRLSNRVLEASVGSEEISPIHFPEVVVGNIDICAYLSAKKNTTSI